MIIVTGEVRFGAGEIERLRPAMREAIEATRAEDGCENYSYAVDVLDPDLLRISEHWRDQEAIDAHMRQPHMERFLGLIGAAKVEALSVRLYDGTYVRTLLGS